MQLERFNDIYTEKRTDYTFKYNSNYGRHGWLRLTPAYSVKLVRDIMKNEYRKGDSVLDPFSGTATTSLVASELGFSSTSFEINPFLIWLGNIKCHNFSICEIQFIEEAFNKSIEKIVVSDSYWFPQIHNIERWWHPETLSILSSIRARLTDVFGEPNGVSVYNLAWIAFSRLIIETSSAAFNHVSMSFKSTVTHFELSRVISLLRQIFHSIIDTVRTQLLNEASIVFTDSKHISYQQDKPFDMVITSPPYPNRISYIRELRPYMYWMRFLDNGSDAGLLDWSAIGGTWGIATSKLNDWEPVNTNLPCRLYEICERINLCGDKNSKTMAKYVYKYFDDMYSHLYSIRHILNNDCRLNYIVGNSSFYGCFVETQDILSDIMQQLDFKNIRIDTIRRRNTKKGLLEFNVKAQI